MSQGLLLIQWRTFNHLTMDQPSTFNQALESSGEGEEGAGVIWVRAERICESSFSITMKRVVTKPNKLVAKNTLCVCVCVCVLHFQTLSKYKVEQRFLVLLQLPVLERIKTNPLLLPVELSHVCMQGAQP